jgi:hypothetical protein
MQKERQKLSVLLEDDHAEEGYAPEHYPVRGEDDYTQDPVVNIVPGLH